MEDFDINNKVGQVCLTIVKKLDFKDIKFPIKVRDIHKIEKKKKKKSIGISAFGYDSKEKQPIYISKNVKKTY